jgi:DNA-binding NarL/FixJ family response regulator
MKSLKKIQLFLVDDDVLFLKSLEIDFFQHSNYKIKTYASGELCLEGLSHKPDLIVLDYYLDGINKNAMNGIQTLDRIKELYPEIPVVMLSSQDKIEVAINCMHHRAYDYVVKSETAFMRLKTKIDTIFSFKQIEKELGWYMERM